MKKYDYDLAIIGGGSGGLTAAHIAASSGAYTLLVDKHRLGGECLHTGCVPSKTLIHCANIIHQTRTAMRSGLIDPSRFISGLPGIAEQLEHVISKIGREESAAISADGVDVEFGHVEFQSDQSLLINEKTITAKRIILATGSHPFIPAIEGLSAIPYLTNESIFDLERLPTSLGILGGGPVAVELGQAFSRLGVHVTIFQRAAHIVPKEDIQISLLLEDMLRREGMKIHCHTRLSRVAMEQQVITCTAITAAHEELTVQVDTLLVATGRVPDIDSLHPERANIHATTRGIVVNEFLQTTNPRVYAIGDVLGKHLFTHVAAYQAGVAVRNALFPFFRKSVSYTVLPRCTFTDPEIASVGLTLQDAQSRHIKAHERVFPVYGIDRAWTEGNPGGFLKLVFESRYTQLIGAHIIGLHASEMIAELALSMQKKLSVPDILNTIHAYPTMNSGIQQAMLEEFLASPSVKFLRTLGGYSDKRQPIPVLHSNEPTSRLTP